MMNCPSCGASLSLNAGRHYLECGYCGTKHFPEPNEDGVSVLGGAAERSCPVCRTQLTNASVAQRAVLYCESCRGLLIPMNTFVEVVRELRAKYADFPERTAPLDARELQRSVECPSCHAPMDTHAYGGPGNIVLDNCRWCKLNWLDHRELRRVSRAADGSSQSGSWELP